MIQFIHSIAGEQRVRRSRFTGRDGAISSISKRMRLFKYADWPPKKPCKQFWNLTRYSGRHLLPTIKKKGSHRFLKFFHIPYTSHRTVPLGTSEELVVEYDKYLKVKAEKK